MNETTSDAILTTTPASRWIRGAAALYDAIVLFLVLIVPMSMLGYWDSESRTFLDVVVAATIAWTVFVALNGYLLSKRGQTIGKVVTNTQIVAAETGARVPLWRLLGFRYAIPGVVSLLPVVGPLFAVVNVGWVFGRDRRCLHDLIAGTRVVVVQAR